MSWLSLLTAGHLALKARYLWLVAGGVAILVVSTLFSAMFSGRQPSTVGLDIGISIMRLILPILLILLTQDLVSREFERRYFLSSLSYPITRFRFLLSRLLTIIFLTLAAQVLMAFALGLTVKIIGEGYTQSTPVDLGLPYIATMLLMALDLFVLSTVAILLATIASTSSFVLVGTLGFMFVARSYSAVIELLLRESHVVKSPEAYQSGLSLLNHLIPDLGALDIRMTSLYGHWMFIPRHWPELIASCFLYSGAIFFLTVILFKRKRLS